VPDRPPRFRVDELPGAEDLGPKELLDPGHHRAARSEVPGRRRAAQPAPSVQPHAQDAPRPGRGGRHGRLPATETAQGIYVNFKNVQATSRKKLPFGIAQIGKAFRNEISPGNFVFRMREFEQMEMQYFVRPEDAAATFEEWLPRRRAWYERFGVDPARLRFREHRPDELAHYAKKAVDVEYRFPFGWKELEGIHNRGDFDLGNHARASGENLQYFDPATEEHFIPWIIETSAGGDRAPFTFLIDAYREEEVRGEKRVSLALHPELAPYKVAGAAAAQEAARDRGAVPQDQGRPAAPHDGRLRRHGGDRQAVSAPGRDRHAVVRDRRCRVARGWRGHRA
jgi:hypothetical protein